MRIIYGFLLLGMVNFLPRTTPSFMQKVKNNKVPVEKKPKLVEQKERQNKTMELAAKVSQNRKKHEIEAKKQKEAKKAKLGQKLDKTNAFKQRLKEQERKSRLKGQMKGGEVVNVESSKIKEKKTSESIVKYDQASIHAHYSPYGHDPNALGEFLKFITITTGFSCIILICKIFMF